MPRMQILALDTSTEWLSVAVYNGRDALVIRERAGNAASERILPLTARVLADAGVSLQALGGIGYGAGPGSFTGVRIACGVVQGMALGADRGSGRIGHHSLLEIVAPAEAGAVMFWPVPAMRPAAPASAGATGFRSATSRSAS